MAYFEIIAEHNYSTKIVQTNPYECPFYWLLDFVDLNEVGRSVEQLPSKNPFRIRKKVGIGSMLKNKNTELELGNSTKKK